MAGGSLWNNVKSRERELWLETYDPLQCTLITYFRIWAFLINTFKIPNCFHNISRKPVFITYYCTSEGLLNPLWSVNFNYLQMLYLTIPLSPVFWIIVQKQICKMCNLMAFWPVRLHASPHHAPYCNIVKLFRKSCLLPVQGGGWRDLSPHPCWPWGADHGCIRMQRRLHLPKVGLSFSCLLLKVLFFTQNNSFTKTVVGTANLLPVKVLFTV